MTDGEVVVGAMGCGTASVTGVGAGAGVVTGATSVGVDVRLDVESDARGWVVASGVVRGALRSRGGSSESARLVARWAVARSVAGVVAAL